MDQQIQINNPKKIIGLLYGKKKSEVKKLLGNSQFHSDYDVWMYNLKENWFFRRELLLFFSKEELIDVTITDYVLGKQTQSYNFCCVLN